MAEERESPSDDQAVLPQAHRTIRLLDPAEGPFRGALVTAPDGPAVRHDAEPLVGWAGWRYAGAQHIAAPLDVIRRARGHDVLLPWCTERVETYVDRRRRTRGGLTTGEVSTVVVSMLRGLAELGPVECVETSGSWWLTDDGRPVLVLGPGREAVFAVLEVLDSVREECADKALARVLDRLRDRLRSAAARRRVPRRLLEEGERELLDIATPRPLERERDAQVETPFGVGVRGALRPRVRAEPPSRARLRDRSGRRGPSREERPPGSVPILTALYGHGERVLSAVRGRAGRHAASGPQGGGAARSARPGRARLLVVAGACAGVVLLAGLLWPSEGDGSAAESSGSTSPRSGRASGASSSPTPVTTAGGASSAIEGPEAALTVLMAQITECREAGDTVCADAVAPGSDGVVASAAGTEAEGQASLVDRYGDIAVFEFRSLAGEGPPEHPTIIVVLVRTDEKWLVRDAYRVADQPK